MKKHLLFIAITLFLLPDGFSQASFNTGAIEVTVNEYGRVRLFAPDGKRQLQRASILVGTSPTTVFDNKEGTTIFTIVQVPDINGIL